MRKITPPYFVSISQPYQRRPHFAVVDLQSVICGNHFNVQSIASSEAQKEPGRISLLSFLPCLIPRRLQKMFLPSTIGADLSLCVLVTYRFTPPLNEKLSIAQDTLNPSIPDPVKA